MMPPLDAAGTHKPIKTPKAYAAMLWCGEEFFLFGAEYV